MNICLLKDLREESLCSLHITTGNTISLLAIWYGEMKSIRVLVIRQKEKKKKRKTKTLQSLSS